MQTNSTSFRNMRLLRWRGARILLLVCSLFVLLLLAQAQTSSTGSGSTAALATPPAVNLNTTIPTGYRASIDSTGLFTMIWRLSSSPLDPPNEYALDAMVFRASAFANSRSPLLSERLPIVFADVTYTYERAHSGASATADLLATRARVTSGVIMNAATNWVQGTTRKT